MNSIITGKKGCFVPITLLCQLWDIVVSKKTEKKYWTWAHTGACMLQTITCLAKENFATVTEIVFW